MHYGEEHCVEYSNNLAPKLPNLEITYFTLFGSVFKNLDHKFSGHCYLVT